MYKGQTATLMAFIDLVNGYDIKFFTPAKNNNNNTHREKQQHGHDSVERRLDYSTGLNAFTVMA